MANQWEESSFNEQTITDVETARLALRWALDKMRALHEEILKTKQDLQEKSSQVTLLENQIKNKNIEIEKILKSHDEEIRAKQNSLEFQLKSKLDRLQEREKEIEDKVVKQEDILKQKETRLLDDYQKKSDELRGRWAQIESELWHLRQEQLLKQQEFEKLYESRIEEEKKRLREETDALKSSTEQIHQTKIQELERREHTVSEELKKQEAVFKWAQDSWRKEVDEREKHLKQKDLDIDKKILEKNQQLEDAKFKIELLEKQVKELPDALKKRDDELSRYKSAMESMEGVVRTLEDEKKFVSQQFKDKVADLERALEQDRCRYKELETEIPKRLKIAIEHERARFHERLSEIETNYREDLRKKQEEIEHLERHLKTIEETLKTITSERDNLAQKSEQVQTQFNIKQEEFAFREKQVQSEHEVRMKVEIEKHTRQIKNELDSAQRIYEDNLRVRFEEITHLRKELESAAIEKRNLLEQMAESRKDTDVLREKYEQNLNNLKIKLRDAHDTHLAVEIEAINKKYETEKHRMQKDFEEQMQNFNLILGRRGEEVERFKMMVQKLEDEKKILILEGNKQSKNEIELKEKGFQETVRMYEDKIQQLNRIIESIKLEKEEVILLEKDRLESMFGEKERDSEARLSSKEVEIVRLREEIIRINNEKDNALDNLAKERQILNKKLNEVIERCANAEIEFQTKLQEAIKTETAKFEEAINKKNHEIESEKLFKEKQEESYRKNLEELRHKMTEALGKFEDMKKTLEEKQQQIIDLQISLSEVKQLSNDERISLTSRLDEKERQMRDTRAEYDRLKTNFEDSTAESQKNLNDIMLKLRNIENQRSLKEKSLEEARKEIELWKTELAKKDEDLNAFKTQKDSEMGKINEERNKLVRQVQDINEQIEKQRYLQELYEREKEKRGELEIFVQSSNSAMLERDEEIAKMHRTLENLQSQLNIANDKMKKKDEEMERLNSELIELCNIKNEHESMKKMLETLKQKIRVWKKE